MRVEPLMPRTPSSSAAFPPSRERVLRWRARGRGRRCRARPRLPRPCRCRCCDGDGRRAGAAGRVVVLVLGVLGLPVAAGLVGAGGHGLGRGVVVLGVVTGFALGAAATTATAAAATTRAVGAVLVVDVGIRLDLGVEVGLERLVLVQLLVRDGGLDEGRHQGGRGHGAVGACPTAAARSRCVLDLDGLLDHGRRLERDDGGGALAAALGRRGRLGQRAAGGGRGVVDGGLGDQRVVLDGVDDGLAGAELGEHGLALCVRAGASPRPAAASVTAGVAVLPVSSGSGPSEGPPSSDGAALAAALRGARLRGAFFGGAASAAGAAVSVSVPASSALCGAGLAAAVVASVAASVVAASGRCVVVAGAAAALVARRRRGALAGGGAAPSVTVELSGVLVGSVSDTGSPVLAGA
jgi:hypothetical protein